MEKELKYVVGRYEPGEPADILFYSEVEGWTAERFIDEFHYLEEFVVPSKIRVHINSEGGSCVKGIGIFSVIQNSKIPTITINDGLAASMASVIWAAGGEFYMKDYSLLMIHNPFVGNHSDDPKVQQMVEAFKKQLSIVYSKRFGFDEARVKEIMDGKEGEDGTWFTAQEAVEAGFLPSDHIIVTPEATRAQLTGLLKDERNPSVISKVMAAASIFTKEKTQQTDIHSNNTAMTEQEIKLMAASLGIASDKATESNVLARIDQLKEIEAKYKTAEAALKEKEAQLTEVNNKLTASEAKATALQTQLDDTNAKLKVFEDDAKAAFDKKCEALVDEAVKACKINKEQRETFINLAKNDFKLAEDTLASIPARENLSKKINEDPENVKAALEGPKTEEEKLDERVKAVVGDDFKFASFSEE